VKYSPISFSAPMVRAILDGRKTQTRRLVRWPHGEPPEATIDNLGDGVSLYIYREEPKAKGGYASYTVTCPNGGEGDRLWTREAFRLPGRMDQFSASKLINDLGAEAVRKVVEYLADDLPADQRNLGRYRASRFMPRAFARLILDVTEDPTVERLESITDEDARAEGIVERLPGYWGLPEWANEDLQWNPRAAYLKLFRSLNTFRPDSNPWVWVTTFKKGA
jgi:hypothetical protein